MLDLHKYYLCLYTLVKIYLINKLNMSKQNLYDMGMAYNVCKKYNMSKIKLLYFMLDSWKGLITKG